MKPLLPVFAHVKVSAIKQRHQSLTLNAHPRLTNFLFSYPLELILLVVVSGVSYGQTEVIHGTTAIIFANTDSIVIGADSRAFSDTGKSKPSKKCKVFQRGDIVFVVTGTPYAGNKFVGHGFFDLPKIAISACIKYSSLNEIVSEIEVKARERLIDYVTETGKLMKPPQILPPPKEISANIILGARENGRLFLTHRGFSFGEQLNGEYTVKISNDYIDGLQDSVNVIPISYGEGIHAAAFWRNHRDSIVKAGFAKSTEILLLEECRAHPDSIAAPLDIARIRKSGIDWITPERKCQSDRPQRSPVVARKDPPKK